MFCAKLSISYWRGTRRSARQSGDEGGGDEGWGTRVQMGEEEGTRRCLGAGCNVRVFRKCQGAGMVNVGACFVRRYEQGRYYEKRVHQAEEQTRKENQRGLTPIIARP